MSETQKTKKQPIYSVYMANGPVDEKTGKATIRKTEKDGKTYYEDKIAVGWDNGGRPISLPGLVSGLVFTGEQDNEGKDIGIPTNFRPGYVLRESVAEEVEGQEKPRYKDGEVLGIMQVIQANGKQFAVAQFLAHAGEDDEGPLYRLVTNTVGFVNGSQPKSDSEESSAEPKAKSSAKHPTFRRS